MGFQEKFTRGLQEKLNPEHPEGSDVDIEPEETTAESETFELTYVECTDRFHFDNGENAELTYHEASQAIVTNTVRGKEYHRRIPHVENGRFYLMEVTDVKVIPKGTPLVRPVAEIQETINLDHVSRHEWYVEKQAVKATVECIVDRNKEGEILRAHQETVKEPKFEELNELEPATDSSGTEKDREGHRSEQR